MKNLAGHSGKNNKSGERPIFLFPPPHPDGFFAEIKLEIFHKILYIENVSGNSWNGDYKSLVGYRRI
jgi:hypothetical protein